MSRGWGFQGARGPWGKGVVTEGGCMRGAGARVVKGKWGFMGQGCFRVRGASRSGRETCLRAIGVV